MKDNEREVTEQLIIEEDVESEANYRDNDEHVQINITTGANNSIANNTGALNI